VDSLGRLIHIIRAEHVQCPRAHRPRMRDESLRRWLPRPVRSQCPFKHRSHLASEFAPGSTLVALDTPNAGYGAIGIVVRRVVMCVRAAGRPGHSRLGRGPCVKAEEPEVASSRFRPPMSTLCFGADGVHRGGRSSPSCARCSTRTVCSPIAGSGVCGQRLAPVRTGWPGRLRVAAAAVLTRHATWPIGR
jgi:hypothetical protein